MHVPALIFGGGFVDHSSGLAEVSRHVMLKAVLADIAQQVLEMRNLHYSRTAECLETIVGELSYPTYPRIFPVTS